VKIKVGLLLVAVLGSSLMAKDCQNSENQTKAMSHKKMLKENIRKEARNSVVSAKIKKLYSPEKLAVLPKSTSIKPSASNRIRENLVAIGISGSGSTKKYKSSTTASTKQVVKIAGN